jgi:hypothetical protein
MIYGTPEIYVEDDQTDQVGVRTLVLSLMWEASRWPMTIEELDAEEPEPPEVPGGMWLVGRQRRPNGGVMRTVWTFDGVNGNGKDVTFKTRGNSPHYGFDPGFAQLPIQVHPKINQWIDEFGGLVADDKIFWPRLINSTSLGGGGAGLNGRGAAQQKPNPLFGHDSYFGFQGGTYWYRYMVRSETEIPDILGKRFSSAALPGGAPRYAGRDWLGAGAPFQRRGPAAVEVMELYWLSEEGGWPKVIYGGGPTGSSTGQHTHRYPELAYVFTDGRLRVSTPGAEPVVEQWHAGEARWREAGVTHDLANAGDQPMRVLVIDVKTANP